MSTTRTTSIQILLFVATSIGAGVRTEANRAVPALAAELRVVAVSPAARGLVAPVDSVIAIELDRSLDRATVTPTSFAAFGRWSGAVQGSRDFSLGDRRVTLTPTRPFSSGEAVMVVLANTLRGADAAPLRADGYSYQFWTAAGPARRVFREIDRQTTRTIPAITSRAYGGIATDLNGDGYLDVTIVNEDTRDLRVFLNRADRTGLFNPFLIPTFPVGGGASPSEPADFNRDGRADIAVSDPDDDTISVLLGQGDGTFAARQVVRVGNVPRGVTVLDADGDGDVDIVNANSQHSGPSMSLLTNDGAGSFGGVSYFDAAVTEPWPLAAADMDHDGSLDLVVGGHSSQTVSVLRATGAGAFAVASTESSGGESWMLTCGDVDGDGIEDVAIVDGGSSVGAILKGDGAGGLAPPALTPLGGSGTASDLGDLDGDGDLDWTTSSYSGLFEIYINAAGSFAFDQSFPAPAAGSCALTLDFDNDGDLDLALVDELADVVLFMQNSGICGNAIVEDEDCDDGGESLACDANCTVAVCGDGTLNRTALEECDDGNTVPADGCDATCRPEPPCGRSSLQAETRLMAVAGTALDEIEFSWTLDPSPLAAASHVNAIANDKRQLLDPTRDNPAVVSACTVSRPGGNCTLSWTSTDPGVTFYQVLSACATSGIEGPF